MRKSPSKLLEIFKIKRKTFNDTATFHDFKQIFNILLFAYLKVGEKSFCVPKSHFSFNLQKDNKFANITKR